MVAMSLDGSIAGPKGEIDWIVMDPEVDFAAKARPFDTLLVGGHTFETMAKVGRTTMPGMETIVFSRTLDASKHPEVTVVAEKQHEVLAGLRQKSGKDAWLFGGGELFRALLTNGFVDRIEVSVMPVMLGAGVPLLPSDTSRARLKLIGHKFSRAESFRCDTTSRSSQSCRLWLYLVKRVSRVIAGWRFARNADGRKVRTPAAVSSQESAAAGRRAW
jgi:dihydrofolate reductase